MLGITTTNARVGGYRGGITTLILLIAAFKSRVLADSGTFEGEANLLSQNVQYIKDSSLYFVPGPYKVSKAYSLKPTDGSGDFAVTRSTTANRFNSSGNFELMAINTPRISYVNGIPTLLIEPQRTNILLQSIKMSTTPWSISNISIDEASIASPDGSITGNKITLLSGAVNALERTSQSITVAAGLTYTYSVFVKANDFTGTLLVRGDVTGNTATLSYNFSTGVVGSSGGNVISVSKLTDYANGWVKLILVFTTTLNPSVDLTVFNGQQINKSFYVWGAQIELGSFSTSTIVTTTAQVTRTVDQYTRTVPSMSVGTFYINIVDNIALGNPGTHLFGGFRLIGSGGLILSLSRSNNLRNRLWIQSGSPIYTTTQTNLKLAITFDGTYINVFENGVKVVTNYAFALTGVTSFESSSALETTNSIGGIYKFDTVKSDAYLIALTT